MLIYSARLRVSEVVKLKVEDIDVDRKLIQVKGAKGRKDRYTILSDKALETIDLYFKSVSTKKVAFYRSKKDDTFEYETRTKNI